MDFFIERGSVQACELLGWAQSRWYELTCLEYNNASAFYRAGVYIWLMTFVVVLGKLWAVRHMVRQILS